jgi:hypothetical protein
VRCFGAFAADLQEMARWLEEKGVRSVALQSSGVYWMPVFEILEQHGLLLGERAAHQERARPQE